MTKVRVVFALPLLQRREPPRSLPVGMPRRAGAATGRLLRHLRRAAASSSALPTFVYRRCDDGQEPRIGQKLNPKGPKIQGQILAVWILAAKLLNSDLNFAVDF